MNVTGDRAFAGYARGLLGSGGNSLLAQIYDGAFNITLGFGERLLAIHHGSSGLLTEFLYQGGGYVHGTRTHCLYCLSVK